MKKLVKRLLLEPQHLQSESAKFYTQAHEISTHSLTLHFFHQSRK